MRDDKECTDMAYLNKMVDGIKKLARITRRYSGVLKLLLENAVSTPSKALLRPTRNNNKCGKFLSLSPRSLGEKTRMNRRHTPNITTNDKLENDQTK